MILAIAVILGLVAGLLRAWLSKRAYQLPELKWVWLVFLAFIPQFLAFNFSLTRTRVPDNWVPAILIITQVLLLIFIWLNRRQLGFWIMGIGLLCNFAIIALNSGMMPISPETAGQITIPGATVDLKIGERVEYGKDVLLPEGETRLAFLSDRFTTPAWFPYSIAFSFGDILISAGAFLLFWSLGAPAKNFPEVSTC